MLTDAPVWDTVWNNLQPLIIGRTLIAYNAPFDRRMIELMNARYCLAQPLLRWRCAMRFVKERTGLRHSLSLFEACSQYGIEPGTHRASSDARATAALLLRLLK
jgi:DNA polymerase-3 subunit epsilon